MAIIKATKNKTNHLMTSTRNSHSTATANACKLRHLFKIGEGAKPKQVCFNIFYFMNAEKGLNISYGIRHVANMSVRIKVSQLLYKKFK